MRIDLDRIRTLRKGKRMTQGEMAMTLGYNSPTGYHYIETGKHRMDAVCLAKIADVFQVSMAELLVEEPDANTAYGRETRHMSRL